MTADAAPEQSRDLVPLTTPREGIPPVLTTPADLQRSIDELTGADGSVAVDAERASGYRYGQRAYLVQLRREGAGTFLIDPTELPELGDLSAALSDTEWVFHAASQDLPSLRELGLLPPRIFDTELASRLLGRAKVGLSSVVADELGFELAKEHSAADWSRRPLPEDWLRYAALDVELLIELRDRLSEQLAEAGKLEWAEQEFEAVRLAPPPAPRTDPWRRTAGVHAVRDPQGLAIVRQLWQARDELAQRLDRSPGRVLPDAAIIAAAQAKPRTEAQLVNIAGFGGRGTRRRAGYWMAAIEEGARTPQADLPPRRVKPDANVPPPPRSWGEKDPQAAQRLDAVRTVVRARAEELQLPQENLLAPAMQRELAWHPLPDGESVSAVESRLLQLGARPWQVEQLALPLAHALSEAR